MTRKPHASVHTKLIAILVWPAKLARSPIVGPVFGSAAGTSLIVPVIVPPGSPFCNAVAGGALAAASLSSAVVGEAGVGACGLARARPGALLARLPLAQRDRPPY